MNTAVVAFIFAVLTYGGRLPTLILTNGSLEPDESLATKSLASITAI